MDKIKYDDYLLLFFLILLWIWEAKLSRDSALLFLLLLSFYIF
ncbi:hypothetical protein [Anaerosalibacter sp. Marseille-P3206]|nr:hypothetical protein [Anaerosalibacter sp. Marseille-P3206]